MSVTWLCYYTECSISRWKKNKWACWRVNLLDFIPRHDLINILNCLQSSGIARLKCLDCSSSWSKNNLKTWLVSRSKISRLRDVNTFSAENLGIIKVNLRVVTTMRGVAHSVISPMIFEQCLFAIRRKWQRMLTARFQSTGTHRSSHALTILWFAGPSRRVTRHLWSGHFRCQRDILFPLQLGPLVIWGSQIKRCRVPNSNNHHTILREWQWLTCLA